MRMIVFEVELGVVELVVGGFDVEEAETGMVAGSTSLLARFRTLEVEAGTEVLVNACRIGMVEIEALVRALETEVAGIVAPVMVLDESEDNYFVMKKD
jgi:hypothetical protein